MSDQVEQPGQSQIIEPAPAQPTEAKPAKRSKWLKGCGIGCGSVLLVVLIAFAGMYLYAMAKIRNAQNNMIQVLNTEYPKWKADNVVPKEQVPMFDDLIAWAAEENATTWKTAFCFYAVGGACRDGVLDERELQQAAVIHDFLQEYPSCTTREAGTLFWASPAIQNGVVALVNEYASSKSVAEAEKE